ncbi:DNA mismatch repair protein MutS [Schinkia azotoformans]|uniref:DNA mismatch repair protein MutS n=1 Tax=Schinkia azotoformans TaxID=1454 RepID=UPI002DB6DC06|nr:DNA mismatch repair protein MutS [Schinkia azotoformans]MEC1721942.1 DNA mismatch repair protein MutS [Schinkia azotoformans]MED4411696.1 DNA mismatch repair protein MutS [Schinkia azotoformans]
MAQYTPMIQQYLSVKAQYMDAFLFFRLGDFYEMFFDDAIKASQELEITLTGRDGGVEEKIPMCGVPYHSAENYINQLIEKGYKVAICEQVEDPKSAKGVVRREVVQLITPGTVMQGKVIDEKENNYIATITDFNDGTYGFAYIDLTTGEGQITMITGDWLDVVSEIYSVGTKEVVVSAHHSEQQLQELRDRANVTISVEEDLTIPEALYETSKLLEQTKLKDTLGRLLQYLLKSQKRSLDHIQPVVYYEANQYMKLDIHSKRNLELVETIRTKGKKGSFLWLLDSTVTAMGARRLKQWIERPLLSKVEIENRLNMVETLLKNFFIRQELQEALKPVYDLERLSGRVAYGNVNARDLIQLKKSLQQVPIILGLVERLQNSYVDSLLQNMDPCESLYQLIERGINENPPLSIKEGDIIKDGYHEKLDTYRDAVKNGKQWIAQLEMKEKQETGIKTLKIGYNRVFGYYIEVTKANIHLLPEGRFERKQTLANAERYITPELKEKEAIILEAEEKIVDLEYDLFVQIREQVKTYIPKLQKLAKIISEIDCLQSFAQISEEYQYTKPEFSNDRKIVIKEGRHPVVEKVLNSQVYVSNDCYLDSESEMLLITGPNMSGKSTYMRQIALTAILAQIGCYVPAQKAVLPIFDQIFTRIGAADDLVSGQSTFMVEMLEAKNAITKATQNSLILLDEIGRGTSTYDGMALAQAIIEYIHHEIGAKTLFSTHYHELTSLEQSLERLKNVHVSAIEENGKVVFLHKVKDGAADKSYGIHVAELAELPKSLIKRAKEILDELEHGQKTKEPSVPIKELPIPSDENAGQLSFFTVIQEKQDRKPKHTTNKQEEDVLKTLQSINLLEMTPLDAMNELYRLQKLMKSKI